MISQSIKNEMLNKMYASLRFPLDEDNQVGPCKICGTSHLREDTRDWVYHESIGVVCTKHHGVREWYQGLLDKANDKLKREGVLS